MIISRLFTGAAVAAAALAASAIAQETYNYADIKSVRFETLFSTVEVKTGAGTETTLQITDGKDASYPLQIDAADGAITIRSDENPDELNWGRAVNWRRFHEDAFRVFLEDYPSIVVTMPMGTALDFEHAVVALKGGDTDGELSVSAGYVDGEIGNLASADIRIHGSADLKVGDISGPLDAAIHGSGDLSAGGASTINAEVHGSGDMTLGASRGDAALRVHGSGDIKVREIAGRLEASIYGSGDINTGAVAGGADLSVHGSGDIDVASVNGATEVVIQGSADVHIAGGRADELRVRANGSGDFRFDGLAVNPDLSSTSSGSITIRSHEGEVRARGRGDIKVSGRHYGDDD